MAVANQEAKTRQLAVSKAPEPKRECGKCPFAKEYNLVERQFVLVDKQGNAHTLNGYVREGGNHWLDGMLSILKQNGAAAEKIYLDGGGEGISPIVLKDGTLIENPHGYFDRKLPVANINGEETQLNFANIGLDDQSVVVKDEEPKCPFGKTLVNTKGLVFRKGEYDELDPNSGMISGARINPIGASMRLLLEIAPAYLLLHLETLLSQVPAFPQNLLIGSQKYDAVAFRQMEVREILQFAAQDLLLPPSAPEISPLNSTQEPATQPLAQAENLPMQEIFVERIRIMEIRREPERREENRCAEEKPAVAGERRVITAELPVQEARTEYPFEEKPAWKPEAPKYERKPEERKEAAGKRTEKKAEPPKQNDVKRANIPVDSPSFIINNAKTQKAERRVDFTNWKLWLPEMPRKLKRKKTKSELPKEFRQEKTGLGEVRKGRRKVISEGTGPAKETSRQKKERKQKVLATEMKVTKAKRAKERREKKLTEELRARKTRHEKRAKEKRASVAAERRRRSDYAEKYLLAKKAKKQKRRNWLSISRR